MKDRLNKRNSNNENIKIILEIKKKQSKDNNKVDKKLRKPNRKKIRYRMIRKYILNMTKMIKTSAVWLTNSMV